jgi:hypothetical protein
MWSGQMRPFRAEPMMGKGAEAQAELLSLLAVGIDPFIRIGAGLELVRGWDHEPELHRRSLQLR